jgi:hypothetical protein
MQARFGRFSDFGVGVRAPAADDRVGAGNHRWPVKDESGACCRASPGGASPALIEKVLSGVSDDQGRYRIVVCARDL